MSVGIVCPKCGTPLTFHRQPVRTCPRCQTEFPPALQAAADAALAQQTTERPLLLTVGMYCSPAVGALLLLALARALTGGGPFNVGDEAVSGAEFIRERGLILAVLGPVCVGVGIGIYLARAWVRWLMLAYWFFNLAITTALGWSEAGAAGATRHAAEALLLLVLAYWYLFVKANVAAYFRALELKQATGALEQRGADS